MLLQQSPIEIENIQQNIVMQENKTVYLTEQSHYKQLSKIIRRSYQAVPLDISLYVEIDEISQFIKSPSTRPLLLTGCQFGGKKTLLCELLKTWDKNGQDCLTICEFASATRYYSEIIYKITVQLRRHLQINQKVELNEQKLRQYFRYWLQVADDKIEKDYLGYHKGEKKQVLIIIEGIDKVIDSKNQPVSPSFWFPDISLKNIKIIITCQSDSNYVELLMPKVAHKIEFVLPEPKIEAVKSKLYSGNPSLQNMTPEIELADLRLVENILRLHPKFKVSTSNTSFLSFLHAFIKYSASFVQSEGDIYKLLACLIWSHKGLSKNTLRRSYKFSGQSIDNFLHLFKEFVVVNQGTYLIISRKLRLCFEELISAHYGDNCQAFKKQVHAVVSKALKREHLSINVLEETIYQLLHSQNFTELKELLSRVENFLMLYTPLTKHILCICWFKLEIQFQYDPVFEYNKAIERFLNHYYPSPEDTFKIIFQLSLFFKEYSEFENSKTPEFRHPPIRGEVEHVKDISIYDQLVEMNMYQKTKIKNKEPLDDDMVSKNRNSTQRSRSKSLSRSKSKGRIINDSSCETSPFKRKEEVLDEGVDNKEVEKLNVRIKLHQQKFKNHYLKEMQSYLNEFYVIKKKGVERNHIDEDSDDSENQFDESKMDIEKIRKGLLLKKFSDFCQEQYHRKSQMRSFYYYKQWIWMQFPWICQSLNSNYSELIYKCLKSPTEYMSNQMESRLINESMKIAKMAKQNKQQIYEKTNQIQSRYQIDFKKSRSKPMVESNRLSTKSRINSPMKSRQKFDVSRIDEQLMKNPTQSRVRGLKKSESAVFMTSISMTQTHIAQESTLPLETGRLPHLGISSRISNTKMRASQNLPDNRDYALLVSKYDELRHENEVLVSKIQSLQQNRVSVKQNNKELQKQNKRVIIEELKQRKAKLLKKYEIQQSFKAKLEIIIKICDINKSHGSESSELNGFLSSLKAMHKLQEAKLDEINQGAKKILDQSRSSYRKLKEQKANLLQKLKKQRNNLPKNLMNTLVNQLAPAPSKTCKPKKNKDTLRKQKLDKDLQLINQQFQSLQQNFGIVVGQSEANQRIFCGFEQKIDKLREIQWRLNELMEENSHKEQQIMGLQEKLNINEGHREHQKELKKRGMQNIVNQSVTKADDRIKCLQSCFALLELSTQA